MHYVVIETTTGGHLLAPQLYKKKQIDIGIKIAIKSPDM